ncbi:MAG: glycosyltransferase family 2 protein [Veillonellales bacterium]
MANQLAVLILTYNEEKNIASCMESVQFADEIIVVDSGSSDKTVEIAVRLGAKVVFHPMDEGFAGQRNFALNQTAADWVLFLDADERITVELAVETRAVVDNGAKFAYQILRKNVVFGQRVQYGGHSPDYSLRLYPRTAIHWEGMVHEQAHVAVPIRKLHSFMLHYTYTDWDRYFIKFNQYTSLMAKQMREKGRKARFTDMVLRPNFAFFRFYILKSGWRDGKIGFIMAVMHGFYTMAKYVKLYYLQKEGR